MSVKVGVRVRPFNQRESSLNCKLCVKMMGNMTRIYEADNQQKHRDFTFDYSFWSHDQFIVQESGYFRAQSDKYADQQIVFEKVGIQILNNAWQGYHCCLFAYGQTGAGKSYSMVGYGANKGIVPISCQEIFNRIAANTNPNKDYQVNVSMMEIYNEKVQDLLIPIAKRPKQGHKIRQHPNLGIYVEGMSKHYVDTYDAIQRKMEQGGRNRSIAATEMNASSSRAHTIISIEFKQTQIGQGNKKRQKLSVINLVDLAGSEKVGKTGATGDRLKQAAGINTSLSALGKVIKALAEICSGKGKGLIVPYRDSCLTRILQNALGGNSKTLMICAISPATDNYQQTLSTLRYADQAKKIQNKAVVNQSQTDKLIRTLTQERQELKHKLVAMQEMFKKLQITPQMMNLRNEAEAHLRFLNEKEEDYQMPKNQKKRHQQQEDSLYTKIDLSRPHLSNLNQDPQLSRKINYPIDKQITTVGKRGNNPPNDIEIGGMGIRPAHAIFKCDEDQVFLSPLESEEETGCYLNGTVVVKQQKIYHLDRISFGTNNIFLVELPGCQPRQKINLDEIDWQFAQNELYLKKEEIERQMIQQKQRKRKQEMDKMMLQKEQQLLALQRNLAQSQQLRKKIQLQKEQEKVQLEKKIRQQQQMIAQKQKQIQGKKRKMLDSQNQQKQRTKQKYYYQRKLLKTLPKCIQLNLIAKQFKKNIVMSVKMIMQNDQDNQEEQFQLKKRTIMIKVSNRDVGYSYWWDVETLTNRYYIIKDLSEQYFETGVIPELQQSSDPFWDPQEPSLIGRGFLTTKALAYMFDNPATLPIIGEDQHCGQLLVNLIPTDQTGTRNLCEQMDQQEVEFEPQQLIDKPLHFLILIKEAKIPLNYKDVFVEYTLKTNQSNKLKFKTQTIQQKTNVPVWNYQKLHTFEKITEEIIKYLDTAKITFKIFGCEILQEEKKIKLTSNTTDSVQLDVQKARKEDQRKINRANTLQPETLTYNSGLKSPEAVPKPSGPKKETPPTKKPEVVYKTTNSSTNNKIIERDPTKKKDKDCQIY